MTVFTSQTWLVLWLLAQEPATRPRPSPETIPHSPSRTLFEAGLALYSAKDYHGASGKFAEAHALEPTDEILFAWAQAERLQGNCVGAVPLYERYLTMTPDAQAGKNARNHLERCRKLLPAPWYRDWIGHALLGAGITSLTVGGVLINESEFSVARAPQATNYTAYAEHLQQGSTFRTSGIVALVLGGVAVTGAIGHYVWFASRKPSSAVSFEFDIQRRAVFAVGRF